MKRGASEKYVLSDEQIHSILAEAQSEEEKLILELMVYLGLRASEIVHLRATWLHGDELNIPRTQPCDCSSCREKGGVWSAKSDAAARSIAMPKAIQERLTQMLLQSPKGFSFTRQALWQKVKRWGKRAKIKMIYPHALRATAATRLAERGMSAPALAYTLGWTNISMAWHYVNIAHAKAEAHQQMRRIME